MSKYISIFALTFGVSCILFFLFGYVLMSEADSVGYETVWENGRTVIKNCFVKSVANGIKR